MKFINKKKINGEGKYFQVSIGVHKKNGTCMSVGIIPKAKIGHSYGPDYKNATNVLLSTWNQAARLSNMLMIFARDCLHRDDSLNNSDFSILETKKAEISVDMHAEKRQIRLTIGI